MRTGLASRGVARGVWWMQSALGAIRRGAGDKMLAELISEFVLEAKGAHAITSRNWVGLRLSCIRRCRPGQALLSLAMPCPRTARNWAGLSCIASPLHLHSQALLSLPEHVLGWAPAIEGCHCLLLLCALLCASGDTSVGPVGMGSPMLPAAGGGAQGKHQWYICLLMWHSD